MDVSDWLRDIGLAQYAAAFRENEIDFEVLPNLTPEDLKEIGVATVGHRRKILAAIQVHFPHAAPPHPGEDAERRHLTVMFCDVVDSTALATRLDPEDMADLIRAFQAAVSAAVRRFDGHVAKWMGDGALVYFGYPHAHEDDADRAVRAALALVEAMSELRRERGVDLEVRAGIATGLVVVGELMGEGEARERGVVGETPNLAARLQGLAEPGRVVVGDSTRRLLGRAFELEPLGSQILKGVAAPTPVWSIVREIEDVSRFEASRSDTMTPMVGREREIAQLLQRWRRACSGEGQIGLISGEAGIGKSRIVAALREEIGGERHFVLRYQCSPHRVNDAFHPIVRQIWRAAGFSRGEPPAARLGKLEAMIERTGLDPQAIVPYLAPLLSLPVEGRPSLREMPPAELRERTIRALGDLFVGAARNAPVLALLEDAHWIDPTSLDVFTSVIERIHDLPVLLVATFRPEFSAPWTGRPNALTLSLGRFGRSEALAMINSATGGKPLPMEVLDQVVAKTDGVPLFVEELIKHVLESGLLREENGRFVLTAELTPLTIPSTLHDSLTARLDRLAPVKEIAQIASAIGREFNYRLLEAVAPMKGPPLQDALDQLLTAELIYARGAAPDESYAFKHALVQDAAYSSLLRSRRQRIHRDIARALETRFANEPTSPAVVAHHYSEAGLAEPAARKWLAAAELALSRSAPTEAERYASAGLALIARIAEGPERSALELALRVARANALIPLKSMTAPETVAALTAAKQLQDTGVGTDLQRVSVLYGLCAANTLAAQLQSALGFARQIVEIAERQDDATYRLVGYRSLGVIQFYGGEISEALVNIRRASGSRDRHRHRALSYRFGWDPGLNALCFELLALVSMGQFAGAWRIREQVRAELTDHLHASTVASATFCAVTWPALAIGDHEALERDSAGLFAYCTEKKVEQIRLLSGLHHAYSRAMRVPTDDNIAALRAALDAQHRSGGRVGDSIHLASLAEALIRADDLDAAARTLQEGFAFVEQFGERYWLADLFRLAGRVALARPDPDRSRAEACLERAVEVARGQEARLLELRAAVDLARLRRDAGLPGERRGLLEPILARIEGGEEAPDVRAARALLRALD